jgi:hypothetical protein
MEQKPVHNAGKTTRYLGGIAIPPGETRMVDARLVPDDKPPEAADPAGEPDPLAELLKLSVAQIVRELPGLDDEAVTRLGMRENLRDNPRKSLLEAIANHLLHRAQEKADA